MTLISGYLWTGFFIIWILWALRTKPTKRRESLRSRLSYTLLLFAGFQLMIFARKTRIPFLRGQTWSRDPWITTTGVAITATGLLLAIWARAYLGTNWSGTVTLKSGHELIRCGPYRWVRHPIYSGLLLAVFGTTIELGDARGFIALPLIYAGLVMKIRTEEQFMRSAFSAEYEEYKRDTGALIPRLSTGSRKNASS